MDYNLLLDIFKIPARTGHEESMGTFVEKFLKDNSIPYKIDDTGNIYNISNPKAPLLSAHLDTVQDEVDASLTKFIKIREPWLSGYGVIGGDDKCGIYIILELIRSRERINFVFSVGEESGGIGIRDFVRKQDFSSLPYGLVLDRRGSDDIICTSNEYGIKSLEEQLVAIGKVFGYSSGSGTFSDADFISYQISCANLSVGYYNPHMKNEFVHTHELAVALNYTHQIIKNVTGKFSAPTRNNKYRFYSIYDNEIETVASPDPRYDGFFSNENYELCDFCGQITDDFKILKSVKKVSCKQCYDKIESEIISCLENDDFEKMREEYPVSETEIKELEEFFSE